MKLKKMADGRALLNVACSFVTHPEWNNLDFSAYARLAHHKGLAAVLNKVGVLSDARYRRVLGTDPDIVLHDLRKGIPYPNSSLDAVYHSHFLEHLEREAGFALLLECKRVLKPSGILRVVVPDLEAQVLNYLNAVHSVAAGSGDFSEHNGAVHALFDQMLETVPGGTKEQTGFVRFLEGIVRGNTSESGEVHRWMYDKHSLRDAFLRAGFTDIACETATTSRITGWKDFALDINADGEPLHPYSLYLEGIRGA